MDNVEKITSDKVRERVVQDGLEAGRQAIKEATKKLTDRGFSPAEVAPLIKEGVKQAARE